MSNITVLTSADFQPVPQKRAMFLKRPGFVVVFFKSSGCGHCRNLEPTFAQLVKYFPGIMFGICDVSQNPDVLRMNKGTNTEFQGVPQIFAYRDGLAFAKHSGANRTFDSLKSFVIKSESTPIQSQPRQYAQPVPQQRIPQPAPQVIHPKKMNGYADLQADYGDDTRVQIPENVTPHNTPWVAYQNSEL